MMLDSISISQCYDVIIESMTSVANKHYLDQHGPLVRYAKLRVAHVPGMPESPPPPPPPPWLAIPTCITTRARLLPDTQSCALRMRWECRVRFPPTADKRSRHASRHVPDALAVSFEVGGGETFLAFPAHAQSTILRIWQKAHWDNGMYM